MIKGMSLELYAEIVSIVQNHHAFGVVPDETTKKTRHHIKYIDSVYDSRSQTIWSVSFRGLGVNVRFQTNHFMSHDKKPDDFKFTTLYDWILKYLSGEWKPSEKILKRMQI